ncbi:MAG TPA: hypothetical protein VII79_06365 [Candidatus Dormibacteraeota bacterium]
MRRARAALISLALLAPVVPIAVPLVAHAATCGAQPPGGYPNDPNYSPAENGQAGQTWDSQSWYLYGCIPQDVSGTSSDPEGASGMSVSGLWNRTTGAHPFIDREGRSDPGDRRGPRGGELVLGSPASERGHESTLLATAAPRVAMAGRGSGKSAGSGWS